VILQGHPHPCVGGEAHNGSTEALTAAGHRNHFAM
jgi:hypothetical protein